MPSLNISKVAVGCATVDALQRRQILRLEGGVVVAGQKFRPKISGKAAG
jgi:hypothetical protein